MALSKIDVANMLTGTVPQGNVANASLGAVTALPGAIATGKVLQVVRDDTNSQTSTTSSSYVATNLNVNITPSSTSSKIFVIVSGFIDQEAANRAARITIFRDSTNISSTELTLNYSTVRILTPFTIHKLDSPSSTSQINYKLYLKSGSGGDQVSFNNDSSTRSQITAFEIAG